MLKSYIPGIYPLIYPKKHVECLFYGELVNELHYWIEKHPHVIQYSNVSDSLFVKINGTLVKKHKQLLQIFIQDLHNYLILPISQGSFIWCNKL